MKKAAVDRRDMTPTEQWEYRKSAAALVRAAVRKIGGTRGIEEVARRLMFSEPSVRNWTAGTNFPSGPKAERIHLVLGRDK